ALHDAGVEHRPLPLPGHGHVLHPIRRPEHRRLVHGRRRHRLWRGQHRHHPALQAVHVGHVGQGPVVGDARQHLPDELPRLGHRPQRQLPHGGVDESVGPAGLVYGLQEPDADARRQEPLRHQPAGDQPAEHFPAGLRPVLLRPALALRLRLGALRVQVTPRRRARRARRPHRDATDRCARVWGPRKGARFFPAPTSHAIHAATASNRRCGATPANPENCGASTRFPGTGRCVLAIKIITSIGCRDYFATCLYAFPVPKRVDADRRALRRHAGNAAFCVFATDRRAFAQQTTEALGSRGCHAVTLRHVPPAGISSRETHIYWGSLMKFQRKKVATALAYAMGVGGVGLLTATTAHAQQADIKVEVTGSNIKRVEGESALPVTVLTRQDIDRSGATNAMELLQLISANNSSGNVSFANVIGATTFSNQTASLRGLSGTRTLILIDGHRVSPTGGAISGAEGVNLSLIPFSAIERVEVLKDGASAIYGSDAVAGVINFIMRSDYRGAEATVQYGTPTRSGGADQWSASGSVGFGDLTKDRYNAFMSLSYTKQNSLEGRDRDFAAHSYIPYIGVFGYSSNTFPGNITTGGIGVPGPCTTPNFKDPPILGNACLFDPSTMQGVQIIPD